MPIPSAPTPPASLVLHQYPRANTLGPGNQRMLGLDQLFTANSTQILYLIQGYWDVNPTYMTDQSFGVEVCWGVGSAPANNAVLPSGSTCSPYQQAYSYAGTAPNYINGGCSSSAIFCTRFSYQTPITNLTVNDNYWVDIYFAFVTGSCVGGGGECPYGYSVASTLVSLS